jgi:hypothetical protein
VSFLKIKAGAIVSRQVIIAAAVVNAANGLGLEADILITSGRDGTHRADSKHYFDQALDFRTKTLDMKQKHDRLAAVKKRLGAGYDVLLESLGTPNEHLHCEWDPK